jgi:ribosomal protein S18 acetylase RimI-like enzyme
VYVREDKRRVGIGTALLRFLDRLLDASPYEFAERQVDAEEGTATFLEKNGYGRYFTEIMMERDNTPVDTEKMTDEALAQRGLVIRNYRDEDYWAYHNIVGVGFYLMREKVGMLRWYNPPSEYERQELAKGYANRYVLLEHGEVIAVSKINGNDISLLGVRPDKQGQGYGTLLLSYWINRILREQQPQVITIDTTQGNPAQRLYQRMGFRQIGKRVGYIKFNKPDSRSKAPKGYAGEQEILEAFRRHGMLQEEMTL